MKIGHCVCKAVHLQEVSVHITLLVAIDYKILLICTHQMLYDSKKHCFWSI